MSLCEEILKKWLCETCNSQDHLARAYAVFLKALRKADRDEVEHYLSSEWRSTAMAFLFDGYKAYTSVLAALGQDDPDDNEARAEDFASALDMVGGAVTRSQGAAAAHACSRSPSPQPMNIEEEDPRPDQTASVAQEKKNEEETQPSASGLKRPREENDGGVGDESVTQPTIEALDTRERTVERHPNLKFREEVFVIKGLGSELPSEQMMTSLFDTVLDRQRMAVQAEPGDKCSIEITNSENVGRPIWLSLRPNDQINGQVILDQVSRVLNSNEAFMIDGMLKVNYLHFGVPKKGGRRINRQPNCNMDEWLKGKISTKTIIDPKNEHDNMCLARSIIIAKSRGTMSDNAFCNLKKPNSRNQRDMAAELCRQAHVDPTQVCGLDEIRAFQKALLPNYRLCVFTDQRGQDCVFKGDYAPNCKTLYLLWHKEHFHTILYPCQAFEFRFLCEKCVKFYNHEGEHKCSGSCARCGSDDDHNALKIPAKQRCFVCFRWFAGDECFKYHNTVKIPHTNYTKCENYKWCGKCKSSYSIKRGVTHICGTMFCHYCRKNVPENHLCYMQKWQEKEQKDDVNYMTCYFDIECTQHTPYLNKPDTMEHKPNLLISQMVCKKCENEQDVHHFCPVCKTRQQIFHNLDDPNKNVIANFITYLQSFAADKKFKHEILLVAHNLRSYDGPLIIQEVIAHKMKPSELCVQGTKIISMTIGKWKFIDSLMFLPMALSAIPKSFGLTELKKGYWPHLANRPEFYNYEGPMLDRDYYCESTMKAKAADEFRKWYDEQVHKNYVFNFRRELLEYCTSDVTILRQGCQAFRTLFEELSGFDPMFNCITLSSSCIAAFRRNFMPEGKIGIVPQGGYRGRDKQSFIALKWLDYVQHQLGRKIQTAESGREIVVMARKVDGYVDLPLPDGTIERRIYQFHGCWYHACPKCYPDPEREIKNSAERIAENKYQKTLELTDMYRRSGYSVIEMWEHQFIEDLQTDEEMKQYFAAHPTTRTPPLKLRDALYGGRTSALKHYAKADLSKGEKIKLVDVCSEYPSVNLFERYPTGHPDIYLEGDEYMPKLADMNGLVKATVLPPRDLYIPVLPFRTNSRLMFTLCKECADTLSTTLCNHEDAKRQITGTWGAPELQRAVASGYKVLRVHEVYQYPSTMKYDPETQTDGLLSGYIRRFMALKIEASGWPSWCDSPEKRQQYVDEVRKHDGIIIDPTKIQHNPALRTLAKLTLNSFWGKFGEKTLREKSDLIYDNGALMRLNDDRTKILQSVTPIGTEGCLLVKWKPVEDSEDSLPTSSLVNAAFTTMYGRLLLLNYLEIAGKRTLYHDTDSVVYISRPGEPDLPLGSHLGQLTDQIEEEYGPGSFILEFVAGGPKNYAYKIAVGGDPNNIKYCVKVRGIGINKANCDIVTYEHLKAMILAGHEPFTVPIVRQIARLKGWIIVTRSTEKKWQPNNIKRRKVGVEHTVPHGYNAHHSEPMEDQEVLEQLDLMSS